MQFTRSDEMRERAHRVIPGGCHTYEKGDDQFPELSPGFIARGKGSHVWDVDGNEYIEYGSGNRSVTLGHAYDRVIEAARREMELGVGFSRPSPIELLCAQRLREFVRGAEMVKFCKDGSTALTAAVRLARAYTSRDLVACCSDQPFFATDDWFIGTTPVDAGVPQSVKDLTITFRYNNIDIVRSMFQRHPNRIAAVVLEPARYEEPRDGFLHELQQLCIENGTVFVLDEMSTGFRWHAGGGQAYYGIQADLSTFGKAMANGFSVSALVGKREIMELGGLRHDRERVFLLSTTHGAETHGLAAALETMDVYRTEPVIERLFQLGERLRRETEQVIDRHALGKYIQIVGKPCYLNYATRNENGNRSQAFRSLLLQETIRRGILMPSLVVGYSHSDRDVDRTIEALDGALGVYRRALDDGVEKHLVGRPSQVIYRRYNHAVPTGSGALPSFDTYPVDDVVPKSG